MQRSNGQQLRFIPNKMKLYECKLLLFCSSSLCLKWILCCVCERQKVELESESANQRTQVVTNPKGATRAAYWVILTRIPHTHTHTRTDQCHLLAAAAATRARGPHSLFPPHSKLSPTRAHNTIKHAHCALWHNKRSYVSSYTFSRLDSNAVRLIVTLRRYEPRPWGWALKRVDVIFFILPIAVRVKLHPSYKVATYNRSNRTHSYICHVYDLSVYDTHANKAAK